MKAAVKNILAVNEYFINNQVLLVFLIFPSLLPSSPQHYLHIKWMLATVKNIFGSKIFLLTYSSFSFQYANQEMDKLQEDLQYIDNLRTELADFFCEDAVSFKLEDCFNILQTFCSKFLKAIQVSKMIRLNDLRLSVWERQREKEWLYMCVCERMRVCGHINVVI